MHAGSTSRGHESEQPGAGSARLFSLLANEQVKPAFQPIVDLRTGEVAGFEALSRPAAESGYAGPSEMFADAEKHALLWPVEELTRSRTLEASQGFPEGTLLFINSTPEVFADSRFMESVEAMTRRWAIPPGRIVLEITEGAEQQVVTALAEQVRVVRERGFQVAIDDVGAGTSGLNRLMMLRPQWIKLDRDLIDHIDQDRFKHNLIRFLVHFARLSGVRVVAEGIERREELSTLIGLGVSHGQGFLLGRPSFAQQTVEPEMAAWIRGRWKATQSARGGEHGDGAEGGAITAMMSPVVQVQVGAPISEVAAMLVRSSDVPGAAVMDGRRYVGWCGRAEVLRHAARSEAGEPVGFITPRAVATIDPSAELEDAIELISVRDDEDLATPLIVASGESVLGMVPMRSVLSALAAQAAGSGRRTDPLTGLAGRVSAEQHVRQLIEDQRGIGAISSHKDAAFIDVRNFANFNDAYGYELGDQFILDLAALLRLVVNPGNEPLAVHHLGVDRFLVTGYGHAFEQRLERLVTEFDASMGSGRDQSAGGAGEYSLRGANTGASLPLAGVGLRVLFFKNVVSTIRDPRELFAMERQLRVRAGRLEEVLEPAESHIVRDERGCEQARRAA